MRAIIQVVHHVLDGHLPEINNLPPLLEQNHPGHMGRIPTAFPLISDLPPVDSQIYFQPGAIPRSPEQAQVQLKGKFPGLEAGRHQG
ncbi:hypothetical protein ES703_49361 [subsurface metagenome]